MDRSHDAPRKRVPTGQAVAVLRLRRGESAWATWTFGPKDAGTLITIGADPRCDWPITSAGVRPLELSVMFMGTTLLAMSAHPHQGARLAGHRLGAGWVSVPHGARLELGSACIEALTRGRKRAQVEAHVADATPRSHATSSTAAQLPCAPKARPVQPVAPRAVPLAVLVTPSPPALRPRSSAPMRTRAESHVWLFAQAACAGPGGDAGARQPAQRAPVRGSARRWGFVATALALAYCVWLLLLSYL